MAGPGTRRWAWLLPCLFLSTVAYAGESRRLCSSRLAELRVRALQPTVVERAGPLYLRRGDRFELPEVHPHARGDKLRQVLLVLLNEYETVRSEHGGTVATYTGARSPQGVFVATAAKALGFHSVVGFGGKSVPESIRAHPMIARCHELGAELAVLSSSGYSTILLDKLKKLFASEGRNPRIVSCGMVEGAASAESLAEIERFLDEEVSRIPGEVHNLVIPVGTGGSAALVIRALIRGGRIPGRVILVQNAHYDRRASIDALVGEAFPYEYHMQARYPYERWIDSRIETDSGEVVPLDGGVEAKAFEWMSENVPIEEEPTLFWIIAETAGLRGR